MDRLSCKVRFAVALAASLLPSGVPAADAADTQPPDRAPFELAVQSGHVVGVNVTRFSPSGLLLATGGPDEVIKLWDVAVGREVRTIVARHGPIYVLAFSPDGRWLASGGWDRTVRIWDVTSGKLAAELGPHDESAWGLAFSPDGACLAVGLFEHDGPDAVIVWDVRARREAFRVTVKGTVTALEFSPDGRLLAVGDGADARVLLRRTNDGADAGEVVWTPPPEAKRDPKLVVVPVDPPAVSAVVWTADGQRIVAVVRREPVAIDVERRTVSRIGGGGASDVARLANGELLLLHRGGVDRWDPANGRREAFARFDSPGTVSPDGSLVARTAGRDVVLTDRASGSDLRRLGSPRALPERIGNLTRYFVVATHPAEPVVASAGLDGAVRVWDLRMGGAPRVLPVGSRVEALAFDARGVRLAAATGTRVKLWRTRGWQVEREVDVRAFVYAIAFDPFDDTLAVLTEKQVYFVDGGGRTRAVESPTRSSRSGGIAFGPDGSMVTGGATESSPGKWSEGFMSLWRERRPQKPFRGHPAEVHAIATSAMGHFAAGGGLTKWMYTGRGAGLAHSDVITLLDPGDGKVHVLEGHRYLVRAVAFDRDARLLASGGGDGLVKIWDVETRRELASFEAHGGDVTDVAFTFDGRYVVSTGMDGVVRLWNADALRPAATLVSLGTDEYVVALEEGHYVASRGGLRGIVFNVGNRAVPFDRFDLALNRPDVVWGRIGYTPKDVLDAYRGAHELRARRLGFSPGAASPTLAGPEVVLVSERPPLATSERRLRLRIGAVPRGAPVDRVLVYVNEVPVPSSRGVALAAADGPQEVGVDVTLARGDNKVEISALDRAGVESERTSFRVVLTAPAARPNLYVVAIGVSQYADGRLDLAYAAKDAGDLAEALRRGARSFGSVKPLILTNKAATRDGIARARQFLEQATVDDEVVVFFAGHGALRAGRYYFLPADFSAERWEGTGVPYEALEALVDGLSARRRLLLIDTCHSGEAAPGEGDAAAPALAAGVRARSTRGVVSVKEGTQGAQTSGTRLVLLQELFADLRRGTGAVVIAAAGAEEYALEGRQWGNGVFTASVLAALRTRRADLDGDGVLRVSELRRFVTGEVTRLTGGRQTPMARRENLEDDFPVR
jgi:WD40 repeat protein/uncharacterized caspase-like protein